MGSETNTEDAAFLTWLELARHEDSAERVHAAGHLPDASPERLVPELVTLLDDPDALVRACAAESLGMFPDQQVRRALRRFLEHESLRIYEFLMH